ncbi:MAG TPA: methyltransferase domain-containing protein [Mycobacteriales bacterium]|nr:methyltransferase domain-containing protein [Mycobacteriales bacterium]
MATRWADGSPARFALARFLVGDGIEVGPGHHPYPIAGEAARVRYVDRWDPEKNRALFPELGGDAPFPKPHVIADLDRDKLSAFADSSLDFVIACHVLEHVADPIAVLDDIYRALIPGGIALVLLPDRRRTFDACRPGTPLEHLLEDNARGPLSVDDAHVMTYLREMGDAVDSWSEDVLKAKLELERERSFHVHCWTEDEFPAVLGHLLDEHKHRWELLDASFVDDYPDSEEFGYVMRKLPAHIDIDAAANFRRIWHLLRVETAQRAAS